MIDKELTKEYIKFLRERERCNKKGFEHSASYCDGYLQALDVWCADRLDDKKIAEVVSKIIFKKKKVSK
jgi:hypothetical protein